MSPEVVILILTLHFIGDFILQSDWMAQNKSTLITHLKDLEDYSNADELVKEVGNE